MLWGGTHNVEAYTLEDKFFVNSGSCTGAFNTDWPVLSDNLTSNEQISKDEKVEMSVTSTESKDNEENHENNAGKHTDESKKEEATENVEEENESIQEEDIEISDIEINGSNVPSFCLLDIQGSTCILYIYMHIDGEVKVDKVVYNKATINE